MNPQLTQQLALARVAGLHAEADGRRQRAEARAARRAAQSLAEALTLTAPAEPAPLRRRRILGIALGAR